MLQNQDDDGGNHHDNGGGDRQRKPVSLPRFLGRDQIRSVAHERILHLLRKEYWGASLSQVFGAESFGSER